MFKKLPDCRKKRRFVFDLHSGGKLLAAASQKAVQIFDLRSKLIQELGTTVFPARFSCDGKLPATGGKNDVGFVWQIEEQKAGDDAG